MQGDSVVGLLAIGATGVIIVAVIYQLGKSGNPIVPDTTTVADNTLGALFK